MDRDTDAGLDASDGGRARFSLMAAARNAPPIRDNLFRLYLYKFQHYTHPDPEVQKKVRAAAAEKIILGNMGLIIWRVRPYEGQGLSFEELVQHGAMGMLRALEKFEVDRGLAFSTYAYHWIRQAAMRAIADTGRAIRVPVHAVSDDKVIRRVTRRFVQEHGREPEEDELLEALHGDRTKAGQKLNDVKVAKLLSRTRYRMTSLDAPISPEEESATFHEIIGEWPRENAALDRPLLERTIAKLSEKQAKVIRLRFGLDDAAPLTLEQIAKQLDLTRERIRQIECMALRRLEKLLRERK